MREQARRYRMAALALAGALLVAAAGLRSGSAPGPAAPREWPSPEELDSLGRYLAPAAPAPALDEYSEYLPARPSAPPVQDAPPRVSAPPRVVWTVSAIVLTDERPLAVVNDQTVRPGSALPGGAEVVSIENDHVVIRERGGTLRTLRLTAADDQG